MGKIAFSIGPLHFFWYGLILAAAILIALLVSLWQARLHQERLEPVLDLALYGIPIGILFARVYYVALNWQLYISQPLQAFYFWHGGLALDGAFLGLIWLMYVYAKRTKVSFWRYADLVTPGVAVGQAIGLWSNLMNQESFGAPMQQAWGIYIDFANRPLGYQGFDFFSPVFLYESTWNLFLFLLSLVLIVLERRYQRIRQGTLFLLYLILFSIGRLIFAGLRIDMEPTGQASFIMQFVSVSLIGGAILLIIRLYQRRLS